MLRIETYELPEFWACALINDDCSGMEQEDIDAMNIWLEENEPGYCLDCSEESYFIKYHDASRYVLACNCLEYSFSK
jgi:hypothetical protein